MAVSRHMALVANAKAGALLAEPGGATSLQSLLQDAAGKLDIIPEDAGTLPERIALAQATGAELVVIAGGDGSVACAAGHLAGTQAALGLIPCGTMNLLARDLGLDPADRSAAIHALANGPIISIDAGTVSGGAEEHLFLCASMLGTPARLSRHREAGRQRGNGLLAWAGLARAAAIALVRNRSLRFTLRIDGQTRQCRTPSLTIVVNALDDRSGRMFGRTRLDGGRLVLYLVHRASVARQIWLMLRAAITGSLRAPEIEVIEAQSVEVDVADAALHVLVDGEMRLLAPPLRYSIRPGLLRVAAPPAA